MITYIIEFQNPLSFIKLEEIGISIKDFLLHIDYHIEHCGTMLNMCTIFDDREACAKNIDFEIEDAFGNDIPNLRMIKSRILNNMSCEFARFNISYKDTVTIALFNMFLSKNLIKVLYKKHHESEQEYQ